MIHIKTSFFSFITLFLILFSCTKEEEHIGEIIYSVKDHFAPDPRTAVFEIEFTEQAGEYTLRGETDRPLAVEVLLDSLERLNINYRNLIRTLPDNVPGNKIWAIVNVSVANIRKEPKHSAELVTQATLGTIVKILKNKGGWCLIQTPDKYLGWINVGGIEQKSKVQIEIYLQGEKIIFTEIYGFSYAEPAKASIKVSDLTSGSILLLEEIREDFYMVSYPDGRQAFICRSQSDIYSQWLNNTALNEENLVSASFDFLGVPYLWGGTSPKALDCSGFTKTVYFLNGLILPRDASQQEIVGALIDQEKNFKRIKKGDLLFFGKPATDSTRERIVHVGMWIGDMKFIHASGDVHISSFDPGSAIFDEFNLGRYLRTKRLIGSQEAIELSLKKHYFEFW